MSRKIALVKNQVGMHESDQAGDDLEFWLNKPAQDRLAAVTFLVNQSLKPAQRIDKTAVFRKSMKA